MMGGTNGIHQRKSPNKHVHAEKTNTRNWYLVAVIWLQLVLICIWFTQSNKQLSEMKTANAEISSANNIQEREQSLTFLPAVVAVPITNVYKEPECEPLSQCQKDCDWEPTFGKVDYHQHQPGSKHVLVTVRSEIQFVTNSSCLVYRCAKGRPSMRVHACVVCHGQQWLQPFSSRWLGRDVFFRPHE